VAILEQRLFYTGESQPGGTLGISLLGLPFLWGHDLTELCCYLEAEFERPVRLQVIMGPR
jgi:hypothetical protein